MVILRSEMNQPGVSMKLYLFCPETGVYQGEDFADVSLTGVHRLPPGATTIAPPAYRSGEVPVFLPAEERWIIHHLVRLQDWRGTVAIDAESNSVVEETASRASKEGMS
jgi:hypothetical protein